MKLLLSFFMAFIIIIATSCSKQFLETPITTDITRQAYIQDLNTCNEYLNGVYVEIAEKVYYGHPALYADLVADNLKLASGQSTYLSQYNWNQIATETSTINDNMNAYWMACCRIIRSANYVISKASELKSADAVRADNMRGQALAIRALMHHQLLNVFSQPYGYTPDASHQGVPYIRSYDWTDPLSTETVGKDYEYIIADLVEALGMISPTTPNKGFIGLTGTKSILARVYLFKKDYAAARSFAVDVCKMVPLLAAENYPAKLFTLQETEAIFQLTPAISTNGYTTLFPSYYLRKIVAFTASDDITSMLREDPNDNRRKWVETTNGVNYVVKFPTGVASGSFADPSLSYYYTVLRSSEMHLTAAECYANLGREDSAKFYVDAIRKRANVLAIPTTAGGQALLDTIYKERRKELSFENFRMFDLLRTGKQVVRRDVNVDPLYRTLPYPSPKAVSPINKVDVLYYGLKQNPTY